MAEKQPGGKPGDGDQAGGAGGSEVKFTDWLDGQDQEIRDLYNRDVNGLKSALQSERDARKELESKLKDLGDLKPDEVNSVIEALRGDLETANLRASFYESAADAGVSNFKLAWLAIREMEAIDSKGEVDWERVRESYPEIFSKPRSVPHAGNRSDIPDQKGSEMDQLLRQAAGIKR